MGLETATKTNDLNAAWPLGTDPKSQGDDHFRLLKSVLQSQFGGGTSANLYVGVRKSPDVFVVNSKADMTGTDLLSVQTNGTLAASGGMAAPVFASPTSTTILATTGAGTVTLRPNGSGSATGQFSVDSTGNATSSAAFVSSVTSAILAATGTGNIVLRPNGVGSSTGQATVASNGDLTAAGAMSATSYSVPSTTAILAATGSGNVVLRPNGAGSASGQVSVATNGSLHIATGLIDSDTTALVLGVATGAIYFRPYGSANTTNQGTYDGNGSLVIAGPIGQKSTGTTWANPSDARLKQVIGPYEGGLAEIVQVQPVVYQLLAHPEYGDQIGVVGQEIEKVMPETITLVEGTIEREGETVTVPDLRQFDANALIFALINAVKELSARVELLEVA